MLEATALGYGYLTQTAAYRLKIADNFTRIILG